MNVMYAADDNFAPILSVSLVTMCRHCRDLQVVVLDYGISSENKQKINSAVKNYDCRIRFINIEKNISKLKRYNINMDRGSIAQFSRLFLDGVIPQDWERVLYLDCDTLVRSSIENLYNWDMQENVICAVKDAFSVWNKKAVGLDKGDPIVNSGVMLIDLNKWKSEGIEKHFLKVIKKNKKIPQGDQGIINKVLRGRIGILPAAYNVLTYHYDFSYRQMKLYRKPDAYYSEKEITLAKHMPVIVHFSTSFAAMRPWESGSCSHPYSEEWQMIYRELGYEIACKEEKMSYKVWRRFGGKLLLYAVGILHAYVKPLIYL